MADDAKPLSVCYTSGMDTNYRAVITWCCGHSRDMNLCRIAALEAKNTTLVETLKVASKMCELCHGRGTYMQDCTLCGDSTYDHYCNDSQRACSDVRCIATRAALAANEKREGA